MEEIIINAVSKYGAIAISGVLVALTVWLIKYLIKNFMEILKGDLKELHKDSLLNAKLNRKSINMQKILTTQFIVLTEYLNRHFNGNLDKVDFKKKVSKANGRKK